MLSKFIAPQVLLGVYSGLKKLSVTGALIIFYSTCSSQIQLIGDSEITVNCEDQYSEAFFPEVINDCGTYILSYDDTVLDAGACLPELLRTFTVINTCDDSTLFGQIIHVIDEDVPTVIYTPFNAVYECPYSDDFGLFDFPVFTDCTSISSEEYSWTIFNIDPCLTQRAIFYYATDGCGNTNFVQWTETFTDTTPPVFDVVPPTCIDCTIGVIDEYPQYHDNCETEAVVIGYSWNTLNDFSTELIWTLTDACGNTSTATTVYTQTCNNHTVELTILSQYPDSNLDIEFDIYNNVTTNVASGTFIIDNDYMSESFCLPDGCYEIYIGPQGNLQEILWELKVNDVSILQSQSFNTPINFSVGISTCIEEGCNNQQACNFSPFDMGSSECCYECVELNLIPGIGNPYYPWEIWTSGPNQVLEISGALLYASVECFDIQPFTTYELRLSSLDISGWNGAVFTISNPEWNWSFSESLDFGTYESVFFTTGGPGCMNVNACNFNPLATIENGTCVIGEGNVITLELTDANSNSWGNYNYQILNSNNQVVLNGTHTGGPVSIHPYCLVDDCYTFQVVGFGGGAGQIGWTLFDDEGNELFTGGAPANVNFGFEIPGNLNNDCAVNIGDLLVFISQFPCSSNCGGADFNSDGYTNIADLLFFTTTFGTSY